MSQTPFPAGDQRHGHSTRNSTAFLWWLFADEAGRCFGASQAHDAFYFEWYIFGEAVGRLLLGRKARPMLRPDQERVVRPNIRSRARGDL
jgi:hypothetical protein